MNKTNPTESREQKIQDAKNKAIERMKSDGLLGRILLGPIIYDIVSPIGHHLVSGGRLLSTAFKKKKDASGNPKPGESAETKGVAPATAETPAAEEPAPAEPAPGPAVGESKIGPVKPRISESAGTVEAYDSTGGAHKADDGVRDPTESREQRIQDAKNKAIKRMMSDGLLGRMLLGPIVYDIISPIGRHLVSGGRLLSTAFKKKKDASGNPKSGESAETKGVAPATAETPAAVAPAAIKPAPAEPAPAPAAPAPAAGENKIGPMKSIIVASAGTAEAHDSTGGARKAADGVRDPGKTPKAKRRPWRACGCLVACLLVVPVVLLSLGRLAGCSGGGSGDNGWKWDSPRGPVLAEKAFYPVLLENEGHRTGGASAIMKAAKNAPKLNSLNFYGFYPGMSLADAKTLREHYGLNEDQLPIFANKQDGEVYLMRFTPKAINRILDVPNNFGRVEAELLAYFGIDEWNNQRDAAISDLEGMFQDDADKWLNGDKSNVPRYYRTVDGVYAMLYPKGWDDNRKVFVVYDANRQKKALKFNRWFDFTAKMHAAGNELHAQGIETKIVYLPENVPLLLKKDPDGDRWISAFPLLRWQWKSVGFAKAEYQNSYDNEDDSRVLIKTYSNDERRKEFDKQSKIAGWMTQRDTNITEYEFRKLGYDAAGLDMFKAFLARKAEQAKASMKAKAYVDTTRMDGVSVEVPMAEYCEKLNAFPDVKESGLVFWPEQLLGISEEPKLQHKVYDCLLPDSAYLIASPQAVLDAWSDAEREKNGRLEADQKKQRAEDNNARCDAAKPVLDNAKVGNEEIELPGGVRLLMTHVNQSDGDVKAEWVSTFEVTEAQVEAIYPDAPGPLHGDLPAVYMDPGPVRGDLPHVFTAREDAIAFVEKLNAAAPQGWAFRYPDNKAMDLIAGIEPDTPAHFNKQSRAAMHPNLRNSVNYRAARWDDRIHGKQLEEVPLQALLPDSVKPTLRPSPVGNDGPNFFGLYDTLSNALEMEQSIYSGSQVWTSWSYGALRLFATYNPPKTESPVEEPVPGDEDEPVEESVAESEEAEEPAPVIEPVKETISATEAEPEPIVDETSAEKPVSEDESIVDETSAEEPVSEDESIVDESPVEEPVSEDESIVDESPVEESVPEDEGKSAADEPPVEKPVPAIKKPVPAVKDDAPAKKTKGVKPGKQKPVPAKKAKPVPAVEVDAPAKKMKPVPAVEVDAPAKKTKSVKPGKQKPVPAKKAKPVPEEPVAPAWAEPTSDGLAVAEADPHVIEMLAKAKARREETEARIEAIRKKRMAAMPEPASVEAPPSKKPKAKTSKTSPKAEDAVPAAKPASKSDAATTKEKPVTAPTKPVPATKQEKAKPVPAPTKPFPATKQSLRPVAPRPDTTRPVPAAKASSAGTFPFCIAVIDPVQIPWNDLSVEGFRLSILYGRNADVSGLDLGGLVSVADGDLYGLEISGLANVVGSSSGALQIAGLANVCDGDFCGWQIAGVANLADGDMSGCQLGVFNQAGEVDGLQIGVFNQAGRAAGLQIGVINDAASMEGVQIGVINIIHDSLCPFLPVINICF